MSIRSVVPPTERLRRWGLLIEVHWRATLVGLAGLTLLLRLIYALEVRGTPIPELWRGSQTDMSFFVDWARSVAAGDWLTNQDMHPYFGWEERVGTRDEWNVWYGGKTFHQAPLYPYFLAVLFRMCGQSLWPVYIAQAVGSALSVVVLASISRWLFGSIAGVLAGVMTALYGPLLFYDFVALRTSLMVLLTAAPIGLLIRAESTDRPRAWLLAGSATGLAFLLRPNAGLMWFLALVIIWILRWNRQRSALQASLLLTGGFAVTCLPLVVRNVRVGAPPFAVEAVGASTFYLSNVAGAPGTGWGMLPNFPDVMRRTNGRFVPLIREALSSHESIADWLSLIARKMVAVAHYFERSNNANIYYAERFSLLLRWATLPYWVIFSLGIVGLYLTWSQRRRVAWLYLAMAVPLVTIALFYQTDRFRIPMIVGLIPLAALTVEQVLCRRGNVAAVLTAVIAVGVVSRWPSEGDPPHIQRRDFCAGADAAGAAGRHSITLTEAREGVRRFPNDAACWMSLASWLHKSGQDEEAVRQLDAAMKSVPATDPGRDALIRLREKLRQGGP